MTNKKKTEKVMYENPDGEIFDVDGALMRHPTTTPGKATPTRSRNNHNHDHHNKPRRTLPPRPRTKQHGK